MEVGNRCAVELGDCTDPPDMFRVTERTAKKTHKCCECRKDIRPGQRYEYVCGKWDGAFDSFHTCLTCARIRKDYGFCFGNLREEVWECLGVDYVTGRIRGAGRLENEEDEQ